MERELWENMHNFSSTHFAMSLTVGRNILISMKSSALLCVLGQDFITLGAVFGYSKKPKLEKQNIC